MKGIYLCVGIVVSCVIACGDPRAGIIGHDLVGSDETITFNGLGPEGAREVPVSTQLEVKAAVNLRAAPSTDAPITLVIAEGAVVSVLQSAPENGFYKVSYQDREGWSYGAHLVPVLGQTTYALTEAERDAIVDRAAKAVGYSYWSGHARFGCGLPYGSCTSSGGHTGEAGVDASGIVSKSWHVPPSAPGICVDDHPYSSDSFYNYRYYWSKISRDNALRADAFVHPGHIFLRRAGGDNWGSIQVYECDCSTGCATHYRTAASDYIVIRRDSGWL